MLNDDFYRLCSDLHERIGGPMTFRLILQPIMSSAFAIRDGLKDARAGMPAYFWTILTNPAARDELLHEGWKAVLRVFILAILIDAAYQWEVLHFFYPGEALIVAVILALIPYLIVRGPVNRIASHYRSGTN